LADVFVGGVLGYSISKQVYKLHHDTDLPASDWGKFETAADREDGKKKTSGFIYVPLDSWVYPAFDRLFPLGLVSDQMMNMRPWTGGACARLVDDARDAVADRPGVSSLDQQIVEALSREFAPELTTSTAADEVTARVDSVYTRVLGISGQPLNDGYH